MIYYQKLVDKFIKKRNKQKLYHYTTNEGLLSILNSQSLHLSEYQFLNDKDEITFGSSVSFRNIMENLTKHLVEAVTRKGKDYKNHITDFFDRISDESKKNEDKLKSRKIYIGCFCEKGDSLGQWKGYSSFGEGFSIGFKTSEIKKILRPKDKCVLSKVIYDETQQNLIINNMLNFFLSFSESELKKNAFVKIAMELIFIVSCFF